jgi:hypothetical protein
MRKLLSGPGCFRFDDRLARGLTVLDLSGAPSKAHQGLVGGVLMARLLRALLARPVGQTTADLVLVVDEVLELLSHRTGEEIGRTASLVRHKKVAIWLLFQDLVQLERRSPDLVPLLQSNLRHLFAFAGSPSSVRWLAPFVPRPTPTSKTSGLAPPVSRAVSHDAEHRAVQALSALPPRVALFAGRGRPGVFIATPTIDLADVARRAAVAPGAVRSALGLEPRQTPTETPGPSERPSPPERPAERAGARDDEPRFGPADEPHQQLQHAAQDQEVPPAAGASPDHSTHIPGYPSLGWTPWSPLPGMEAR